ncbi:MAG: oxygenase MpaB family protein [Bacteroidota bacterium]
MNDFTTAFLQEKRLKTDHLADNVITQIIESGNEHCVNDVFMKLVRNDDYSPEFFDNLPKQVRIAVTNYFEDSAKLPTWANQDSIQQGERLFALYGPEIFMLLNVKSLPLCYTCAKGAKVLYDTGRLIERGGKIDPLVRRLMETAQMVMNVLQPDGLTGKGKGIVTMQKVRLIHASIRYFLKHEKTDSVLGVWDTATYGEPINQEDLAGTLMSFSPIILSGLLKLKIQLSDDEIAAYTHTWNVIGHMMGIDDDLLPANYEQAWKLTTAILKDQAAVSMEGKALTESCIDFMKYIIPGKHLDNVPEYMIWYFLQDASEQAGSDLATMIGVENHVDKKAKVAMAVTKWFSHGVSHLEHSSLVQKLTSKFNKAMLSGFLKHYNDGKNIQFFIPPSLQKNWQLPEA